MLIYLKKLQYQIRIKEGQMIGGKHTIMELILASKI